MEDNLRFNPFTDRLSRDIRNNLSSALLTCLAEGTVQSAVTVADQFLATEPEPIYVDYITERLRRYRKAIDRISGKIADPFLRSFILWDLELFFEMHEVLEHDWYHAEGDTKLLMQALIRAAGVYIKLECQLIPQARKIAAKALPILEQQRDVLEGYFPPDLLIAALRSGTPISPKLLAEK